MTDLNQRVIGAFYFLPLIIGTLAGQPYLGIVMGILQIIMCYELVKILAKSKGQVALYAALFILTAMSSHLSAQGGLSVMVPAALLMASMALVLNRHNLFCSLFTGAVLICLMSLSWLILTPNAVMMIVSLAMIITACDIAAYFVGRAIGGVKLAPSISPGKTVSGAIGGLIGASIIAVFMASHLSFIALPALVAGIVIGILAQAGDLYESAFKRRMNIKDSSQIIPGHGGVLDRFDGYIFVIPVIVAILLTQV